MAFKTNGTTFCSFCGEAEGGIVHRDTGASICVRCVLEAAEFVMQELATTDQPVEITGGKVDA